MAKALAGAAELDREALIKYQAESGLVVDGVRGPMTRASLIADALIAHMSDLIGYRGSFGLLIRCEGFRGRLYWPGGQSGVTLDFGWDLGHGAESVEDFYGLYGHLWPRADFDELCGALDLQGKAARDWLKARDPKRWPITREQAARILPRAAGPYWGAALKACPALREAPPRVQTALLSVTYSAWIGPALMCRTASSYREWAQIVRGAKGHKPRHEIEAQLIESCA